MPFLPCTTLALILVLAPANPLLLRAEEATPRYVSAPEGDLSPKRDLLVESYRSDARSMSPVPQQIWLVSTADPAKRRLLFSHERSASVLFSDDEEWLVINNRSGSSESSVLLFARKGKLEYEHTADLTDAAWAFFDRQNGLQRPNMLDHLYVEALRWATAKPPTLLLCLSGHGNSGNYTDEWYCLCNVETKTFSLNFRGHNRKNTKLDRE
jgi:hypothetical protein